MAASPINYLQNVRAPLLVLHGGNDPLVPVKDSEQVVDILKREGRTVEAHYYPNEGHGLVKREDRIDSIQRRVEWFDRYLKKSRHGLGTRAPCLVEESLDTRKHPAFRPWARSRNQTPKC
jgi:acetyl esterase/lipase